MMDEAAARLPPHDIAAAALYKLLRAAPIEAEIWDVLGLTLKTCRAMSLPPSVGSVAGKRLLTAIYEQYMEVKGAAAVVETDQPPSDEDKKARLAQYLDLSDLLSRSSMFMLKQMSERQQAGAAAGEGKVDADVAAN